MTLRGRSVSSSSSGLTPIVLTLALMTCPTRHREQVVRRRREREREREREAHLVSIVLKGEEKMGPQRHLVPVGKKRTFLQVTYEPSDWQVI